MTLLFEWRGGWASRGMCTICSLRLHFRETSYIRNRVRSVWWCTHDGLPHVVWDCDCIQWYFAIFIAQWKPIAATLVMEFSYYACPSSENCHTRTHTQVVISTITKSYCISHFQVFTWNQSLFDFYSWPLTDDFECLCIIREIRSVKNRQAVAYRTLLGPLYGNSRDRGRVPVVNTVSTLRQKSKVPTAPASAFTREKRIDWCRYYANIL